MLINLHINSIDTYLIDLFLSDHYKSEFSNYADDTTHYNCRSTFSETISDASKYHIFLLNFNAESINIKSSVIEISSSETFLDITIDSNFTFEKHINELCKKGNLKLYALTKCTKFKSTKKRRLILPFSLDVPYKTTKQSNQWSARKVVKSNISR